MIFFSLKTSMLSTDANEMETMTNELAKEIDQGTKQRIQVEVCCLLEYQDGQCGEKG